MNNTLIFIYESTIVMGVVDAVVVRSVDPALDEEALRVITSSPKWTPGKQDGKKTNVLFTFPINFVL